MPSRPSQSATLAVLAVIAVLPHAPFVTSGCLTDDFIHIGQIATKTTLADIFGSVDGFGFYRPVQTATYLVNALIAGSECAASYRATNLALHAVAVLGAYALALAVLLSRPAALVAALMFALAPKAAPIAVMWISARSEILTALFVIGAALLWVRWLRGSEGWLLMAVAASFAAALLSKEGAILLPVALLLIPGGIRPLKQRVLAAGALMVVVPAIVLLRTSMGVPLATLDFGAYEYQISPLRWLRNYSNYFGRAVVPAAVVLLAVWLAELRKPRSSGPIAGPGTWPLLLFGIGWFTVFMLPVLPLVLRSEARIYLPAFGLCIAAAAIARSFLSREGAAPRVALMIVAVLLGGYQAGRAFQMREQAQFSDAFVRTLDQMTPPFLAVPISLIPADAEIEQLLRDSVDGYAGLLYRDLVGPTVPVTIVPTGTRPAGTQHILVEFRDGVVRFN
jgi:hypothetical protein